MIHREIGIGRLIAFDHRDGEQLRQLDQGFIALHFLTGGFGNDGRVLAVTQHPRDLLDIGDRWCRFWHWRRGPEFRRRRPLAELGFDRHTEIGGAWRQALCQLAGADDLLVQRVDAGGLGRPFDDGFRQPLRAADDTQIGLPLSAGIEPLFFAIGQGFARHHDHGNTQPVGAIDAHRALQEADAGMQHHRLHPAGEDRIANGEIDCEGLMRATEIDRAGRVGDFLARERFPHCTPFRPRRGHDVIDIQTSECLNNGFAAIDSILHMKSLPGSFVGLCRHWRPLSGFKRPSSWSDRYIRARYRPDRENSSAGR